VQRQCNALQKTEVTAAAVAIGVHGPNCWLWLTAVETGERVVGRFAAETL